MDDEKRTGFLPHGTFDDTAASLSIPCHRQVGSVWMG